MTPRDEFLGAFSIALLAWLGAAIYMLAIPVNRITSWENALRIYVDGIASALSAASVAQLAALVIGGVLYSGLCGLVFGFLSSFVPEKLGDFAASVAPPPSKFGLAIAGVLALAFLVGQLAVMVFGALKIQWAGAALF